MSNFTHFSFNVEKGLFGNIGKMTVKERKDGTSFMDLMIFLPQDGEKGDDQINQIVNADFPQAAFKRLENFKIGDFVCVKFDRMTIAKGISNKTKQEAQYVSVRAKSIDKIERVETKAEAPQSKQEGNETWGEK